MAVGPEGKVDNRLTNSGTKRHRNYVVEFKHADGHGFDGGATGGRSGRA